MNNSIKTGPLYMKTTDGDLIEVGSTAELDVTSGVDYGELDDMTSVVSFTVPKQSIGKIHKTLLQHKVWYKKRKGKRYVMVYRYKDIIKLNKERHKKAKRLFRKLQRRWIKRTLRLMRPEIIKYFYGGFNERNN